MGWDSLSPGIRGSSGTPRSSPFFSFLGWLLSPLWEPAEAGPGVGPGTGRPPFLLHLLAHPCSGGSFGFLPQTFGGPLLLALNPHRDLPLFSPEVMASYYPRKAPNTTP